jgi:hypothetical protein
MEVPGNYLPLEVLRSLSQCKRRSGTDQVVGQAAIFHPKKQVDKNPAPDFSVAGFIKRQGLYANHGIDFASGYFLYE